MGALAFDLRNRQKAVFETVLSPNSPSRIAKWKVLVCDKEAHSVLSALFKPSSLRRRGVTLQAQIDNPRGAVPDVSAVYVIAPTPENIAWVLKDLAHRNPLYRTATVCFTNRVQRPLLAALAAQLPLPAAVTAVKDLYCDFVSLEQDFFSLNMPASYLAMKHVSGDAALQAFVDTVASRLLSVLLTLGVIPIIRAQRGGAAEAVSSALDRKLRDNLELFDASVPSRMALSFRRPLLLMLDRDFDLTSLLHHTWTYQALVHDCLRMDQNTVTLTVSEGTAGETQGSKTYALDKDSDFFWENNASTPFPSVAEAIQSALTKYREDVDSINTKANGNNVQAGSGDSPGASHLAAAIASLPELSRRKEVIDVHTNIATALLDEINKRSLDSFFELECQIMNNSYRAVTLHQAEEFRIAVIELLKGVSETGEKQSRGTSTDRLRLFLIYYSVFGGRLAERTMAEFRGILGNAGLDTSIVDYVGRLKGFQHRSVSAPEPVSRRTLNTAKLRGIMKSAVNRGYQSFTNVAQNAKKLVVEERQTLAVSRTLEIFLSEQGRSRNKASASAILDGYLMYDPKQMASTNQPNIPSSLGSGADPALSSREKMRRMLFSDAIVFMVGGGNYVEFENCKETVEANSSPVDRKNVLYGTTEVPTAEDFLKQLATISRESAQGRSQTYSCIQIDKA